MFMRPVTLASFKNLNVRLKFCSSVSADHLNPKSAIAPFLDSNQGLLKTTTQAHKNLPSTYFSS